MLSPFKDPVLSRLHHRVVAEIGEIIVGQVLPERYFEALIESIVSQQLSTKVADVIMDRVRAAVGVEFTPEKVLQTPLETLRAAGLSNAKTRYVHNIAQAWVDGVVVPETLASMSESEVIATLTQIKGVGPWTAEMFMMFTLGRPDIFSVGDYGLRKAILRAYQLPETTKPAEILALAQTWAPYRTLASRVLWRSLELKDPV